MRRVLTVPPMAPLEKEGNGTGGETMQPAGPDKSQVSRQITACGYVD